MRGHNVGRKPQRKAPQSICCNLYLHVRSHVRAHPAKQKYCSYLVLNRCKTLQKARYATTKPPTKTETAMPPNRTYPVVVERPIPKNFGGTACADTEPDVRQSLFGNHRPLWPVDNEHQIQIAIANFCTTDVLDSTCPKPLHNFWCTLGQILWQRRICESCVLESFMLGLLCHVYGCKRKTTNAVLNC